MSGAGPSDELLLQLPRYLEGTVQLLGQDFRAADAPSFFHSYREIFQDEIYKFVSTRADPTILDCGANYGTSVVYFKSLFPECKITAVEADPKIFELLTWNVGRRQYHDVQLINKAISTQTSPVRFHREGADAGRIHFLANCREVVEVQPVALDDLIDGPIDFLKMDIEGAETDAICSSQKLDQVTQLFVEYHSFQDAPQTLTALLDKLAVSGFRYFIHTQFCSPRPLTEPRLQLGMDLQLNIFATKI